MRPAKLDPETVNLHLANLPGWTLETDGRAIAQDFTFKDFAVAWTFMCRIAAEAEKMDHHPEWSNVYNRVSVRLTTHHADGLTDLDIELAQKINQIRQS